MYRILLAHTRHFDGRGDSTYNFNLANILRKKGHEICFFAMSDERNIPDPNCDLFVSNIDFKRLANSKSLKNRKCDNHLLAFPCQMIYLGEQLID